ncbi:NAD(P)-binding protein [Acaromyces ingoldii]|uniref:NAD(P)-binding protein n=1 Tax=Acaromyces ingoldii TaxID=215250 RepID=A0A316YXF7_9BASI|nr:NAD(P)-binding protein [Acaromyces ingoldii]PWN92743.1 NAD(P)-binding protein [Acaromyces ingoldii]
MSATNTSAAAVAAAKQIVVILGAGPGLGLSAARVFAREGHPVALLSRTQSRLDELAKQINDEVGDPGRAKGYAVDATKREAINGAFESISKDFKSAWVHTAIFNPGGGFIRKPLLETTEEDIRNGIDTQAVGGLLFAQAFIRTLQSNPKWQEPSPFPSSALGNLIITGATASLKGSANFSAFAASKFGLRAIAQSAAREYGPQGIHVSHFIIDGIIQSERVSKFFGDKYEPHTRMDSDAIAQVYLDTARQHRNTWSFETDLRPGPERW